jgi:hypothetical protein
MSAAEIADNKWELQAAKPPIGTAPAIAQLVLMTGFAGFFAWIIVSSVIGIVTPKKEDGGLAGTYKNLGVEAKPADE